MFEILRRVWKRAFRGFTYSAAVEGSMRSIGSTTVGAWKVRRSNFDLPETNRVILENIVVSGRSWRSAAEKVTSLSS